MAWLHGQHAGWRLSGASVPPRDTGVMWSTVVAGRLPQIAHSGWVASMVARRRAHRRLVLRPLRCTVCWGQWAVRVSVGQPGVAHTFSRLPGVGRTWATP